MINIPIPIPIKVPLEFADRITFDEKALPTAHPKATGLTRLPAASFPSGGFENAPGSFESMKYNVWLIIIHHMTKVIIAPWQTKTTVVTPIDVKKMNPSDGVNGVHGDTVRPPTNLNI